MPDQHSHDETYAKNLRDLLGYKHEEKSPTTGENEAHPPKGKKKIFSMEKILRAFWTISSIFSMTVTLVLIVVLLLIWKYAPFAMLQKAVADLPPGIGLNTPVDLLQGLYDNFEKMDNAHIRTEILVQDQIPVAFTLSLNEKTTVVLSEDVTIPGARVALTTGGLNIFNAPATVTLPAGTELPIALSLQVPVNETIPITLNVPVDIALNETDLHEPFFNLQKVVLPLYCLLKPELTNAAGIPLCPTNP